MSRSAGGAGRRAALDILRHARSGTPFDLKGLPQDDELVDAALTLAREHEALRERVHSLDDYLLGITDVLMVYAAGDYSEKLAEDTGDDTVDAIGLGLNMMAEEIQANNVALAEARDAALAANTAKSTFLANMSHELRTPLNAIIGYAELVADDAADFGATEMVPDLHKILKAARHLLSLISDVLDLSKIEAGKMTISLEELLVQPTLSELGDTVRPLAEDRDNQLVMELEPELGIMRTDAMKVRQIVLNLLSNASKFTRDGTITLSATRTASKDGEMIEIRVTDTGIGIPPEKVKAIFSPFTQAEATTARRFGGTGLGLAISHRFAQMLGGDITVESVVGEGSAFIVTLPAESEPDPLSTPAPAPNRALEASADGPQLLVVDDDPVVHELMERHFAGQGCTVISAMDGRAAIEMARRHHPACIVLDVLMPGMDGWSALTHLKADPELADIPVVMLSMVHGQSRGLALGAAEYLIKPVEKQRLLDSVGRFVRNDGATIMIVDDEPSAREVARRILTAGGEWTIIEAANGKEAVALLEQSTPDVVLLDLMMPEMDGFQVVDVMRSDPRWSEIPLVVLTAMQLTDADIARLQEGVAFVLQKGADSAETLLRRVSWVLANRNVAV